MQAGKTNKRGRMVGHSLWKKIANLKTLGHKQDALEELKIVCFRDKDSRR